MTHMRRITIGFLALSTLFICLIIACSSLDCDLSKSMTKEAYLQSFGELVDYTVAHCNNLERAKARTMDAIFELYSQDLYKEFYPQLSREEIETVWRYRLDYLGCKANRKLKGLSEDVYRKIESELMD